MAKSPWSWVISIWKWTKIHDETNQTSLSEFIMSNESISKWENEWNALNIIDAWNKSYNMYFNYLDEDNVLFLRYEDLITDFQGTMGYIGQNLSLSSKVDRFVDYKQRADNWIKPDKREKLDLTYYKDRQYLDQLDENSIAFMKDNLDRELMKRMGYSFDFDLVSSA